MLTLITRFWSWLDDRLDITYRPERHFMRGPGPKTRRLEERLAREAETSGHGAEPVRA